MNESQKGWQSKLHDAVREMLDDLDPSGQIGKEHYHGTPRRVAKMFPEMFWGLSVDPASALNTAFPSKGDEMVSLYDMEFCSYCAHHLLPFYGKAHFAYIPNGQIIGLSKIARLLKILSARPQVQENLCSEMADVFMKTLKPKGVAVCMDAVHSCMFARGVRTGAVTRTTALRGLFTEHPHAKTEFMHGIKKGKL